MTLSHYVFSIAAVSVTLAVTVIAAPLQPVTSVDSKIGPPLSGGGDSVSPIVTPDGRFVLFASTANNLAMNGSSPYQAFVPPKLNVFRRDRVKGTTILVSVNTNGTGGAMQTAFPLACPATASLRFSRARPPL
jgi:ABC-type transport system involved in multi-copper enzyme maturation permease subunit